MYDFLYDYKVMYVISVIIYNMVLWIGPVGILGPAILSLVAWICDCPGGCPDSPNVETGSLTGAETGSLTGSLLAL